MREAAWPEVHFERLFSEPSRNGVSVPKSKRGGGVLMVNMGELFAQPRLTGSLAARVPLTPAERSRSLLETGDLLFARRSLTVEGAGQCAIVLPCTDDRTWESSIIRVRLNPQEADPNFYFYYFQSTPGRQRIESIIEQVAAAGIRNSDLRLLPVPLPPLTEQRAIAEVLGALDDKIAANQRTIGILDHLIDAEYQLVRTEGELTAASMILEPTLGGTPSRNVPAYWNGGIPWATAKDIGAADSQVILTPSQAISKEGLAASAAKLVPAGTTIITARGTVGALARTGVEMSFNQTCYALLPKQSLPPLLLFVAVRQALGQLRGLAHGTIFDTITKATFDLFNLQLPPESEWSSLMGRLTPLNESVVCLLTESRLLSELRDVLLPKLLSGELRVRDLGLFAEEAV
jgi:type I restriction enzyme S subunit